MINNIFKTTILVVYTELHEHVHLIDFLDVIICNRSEGKVALELIIDE